MPRWLLVAMLLLGSSGPLAPLQAQSGNCGGRISILFLSRTNIPSNFGGGVSFSVRFDNPQSTPQRFLVTYTGTAMSRVNRELTIPGRQQQSQWIATLRSSGLSDQEFRNQILLTCY